MKYVVNEEGEILETIESNEKIAKLKSGDKVVRNTSIEYLLGSIEVKFKKFYKINENACLELCKYGNIIINLLPYIGFADGKLIFVNGKYVRPKHLCGMFGKKTKSGNKIIQELIENDMIHKHKDGKTYYFTFNPYIAIKGTRITEELYEDFKNTKFREILETKRKRKKIEHDEC